MGSTTSTETKSCFSDDCFLRVPGHDEDREKFDKRLLKAREVEGDHNIKVFKEDIRTLETVMLMCLFKLSQYSFDYKLLVKDLKNEDQTMNDWLGLIRNTVFRNFNVMKQSKISSEARKAEGKTVDGRYDTWSLSFKRLRPKVETGKVSGRKNTEAGSEERRERELDSLGKLRKILERLREPMSEQMRKIEMRRMDEIIQDSFREFERRMMEEHFSFSEMFLQRTRIHERAKFEVVKFTECSNRKPKNQETLSVDNRQNSSSEVKNSDNFDIPQSSESDQPTCSNSDTPEKKEESDIDDFEKRLQQEMEGFELVDEKIRELNEQINQQKLKIEEDKKNADQNTEVEAREFEERIKRIEMEVKNSINLDIPGSSESDQPTSSKSNRPEASRHLKNIMEMGLINSSEANMKREPDFTDDCYFRVSGFDKEREEFYKWLYNEKKLNNQNKVLEYQENTRTIETIMFFCLYKLSNRSFEYNVLTKQVENENVVTDEKLQQLYRCLLAPIFCNFAILKQSNISMEIRKTTDGRKEGVYDCYNLQYKMLRPLQNHKVTKEEKTRTSGNDNSYVYVTVKQQNIVPDNQEEETSNDSQEDQPEERKESDTIKENSKHETTPDTNKKEESEDSDMDDFEKLLQQKMQGDNFEDEKIRELNEKIKQQKVKMEEDKKNADQKVEAEEREFEENRNRIETEFRKAEKHKQKLNNEEMEKRRREREEYERETENIRQQHIKELHNFVTGFLECIKLKIKWEMKEEEWVDWLKTLRSLVARARNQFLNFEASVQSYGVEDKESRCWVEEDLGKLRQEVRSTHDVLYDAYFFIKELSTQHSDHTFLFILQKQLSKICDILLTVLKGIDETKIEEENCLENLRSLFSLFDSSDIYYTSELRKLDREQDIEKYKDIEDPKKYEPKSDVKKKEMAESSEKTDGKSETQETLPGNLSENEEVTEKGAEESKADQPGVVTESDNCDEEKHPNDEEGNGDEGENNTRRETQMETHAS